MGRFVHVLIRRLQLFRQRVPEGDDRLFGQSVHPLSRADLPLHVRSRGKDRIEMIQRALVEAHVNAHHVVRDIDVLGILAHQRALDVEGVKVGRGHGDHVGIQPHHQGDQLLQPDVVGADAGLCLCQFKHGVIRVGGDVVNRDIGGLQQSVNQRLVVLIEAAPLGVDDQMLVDDAEKALVIRALPLGKRPHGGVVRPAASVQLFDLVERLPARLQLRHIHKLFGIYDGVEQVLLQDGEHVAGNPVQRHAGGNKEAQHQRDADRQHGHAVLVEPALIRLQDIDAVLHPAEQEGESPRQHGHQRVQPPNIGGFHAEVKPAEGHIQPADGSHRRRQRRIPCGQGGEPALRRRPDDFQLSLLGADAEGVRQCPDGTAVQPQDVRQRLLDDVDHRRQQQQLDQQRDGVGEGVIADLPVQRGLLLRDALPVAVELRLEAVDLRLDAHHADGVLMHPHRHGQDHELGHQREQNDGKPVVTHLLAAPLHDIPQRVTDIVHDVIHALLPLFAVC